MRKILGVLFGVINTCCAQQGFHIGANIGLNTVWISHQDNYGKTGVDHVLDYGVAPAINAGYNFTDNVGLQMDFIYSLQGAKYQQTLHSGTANRAVALNYFKTPLYFKYSHILPGAKNVRLFIMGGPQIALLLSASITSNYLDTPYIGNNEKYRFESIDFELAGEAGADIYATDNLYFTLGLRVDYGLTNMNAPDPNTPTIVSNNATGGIIAGISYVFKKKK